MAYKSDEKSAFKKFFDENKTLVFMLPILVVLVVVVIFIYTGNFGKNVPAASYASGSQTPPPEASSDPGQPQVEVLPQIIRPDETDENVDKDPFDAPMVLTGTLCSIDNPSAIVESGGVSYIVRMNDIIGETSWKVSKITQDSLTLESGEKTEVLKLPEVNISDNGVNTKENIISINVRKADIRDVLSAIGLSLGKSIIFTGQPTDVDYSIQQAQVKDALSYLLKTLSMDFIEDESTLIVGTRDTLTNAFFNNIALTRFSLQYLSSDIIASQIDSLGIPVKKVTLDSNKNLIWVQGLPQELGKVRELIALLDKSENVTGQASTTMLTPLTMTYITAGQMNKVLSEMGLPDGMILESNPMTLWVYGDNGIIAQIGEIKKKVDIAENAQSESILLTPKKLDYLTTREILPILTELNVKANILTFERKLQTLWLTGDSETVKLASSIIDTFDVAENINYNAFFVHKFANITAEEGKKRFDNLGIQEANTYTFNFPELSKSLMVFCPSDYKQTVINNLTQLDVMTEKIKVPIDYSDVAGGASRLQARRDLLVNMTGLPASSFTISNNISRDDTPHFIMYLEETSEVIQRVKDLIKFIDNPANE